MDAVVSVVEALSHRSWHVIVMLGAILLLRSQLMRAICWVIVLRIMGVPRDQWQSILTEVAKADLGLSSQQQDARRQVAGAATDSNKRRRPRGGASRRRFRPPRTS